MTHTAPFWPEIGDDLHNLEVLAAQLEAAAASGFEDPLRKGAYVASEYVGPQAERAGVALSLRRAAGQVKVWNALFSNNALLFGVQQSTPLFEVKQTRSSKKRTSKVHYKGATAEEYCVTIPAVKIYSARPLLRTCAWAMVRKWRVACGWFIVASMVLQLVLTFWSPGAKNVTIQMNDPKKDPIKEEWEDIIHYRQGSEAWAVSLALYLFTFFLSVHLMNKDLFRDTFYSMECISIVVSWVMARCAFLYNRYATLGRYGKYDMDWQVWDAIFCVFFHVPVGIAVATLDCWQLTRCQKLILLAMGMITAAGGALHARFQSVEWSVEADCIGPACGLSPKMFYIAGLWQVLIFLGQYVIVSSGASTFGIIRPSFSARARLAVSQETFASVKSFRASTIQHSSSNLSDRGALLGVSTSKLDLTIPIAPEASPRSVAIEPRGFGSSSSDSTIACAQEASPPNVAIEPLPKRLPVTSFGGGAGLPQAPATNDNSVPNGSLQTSVL